MTETRKFAHTFFFGGVDSQEFSCSHCCLHLQMEVWPRARVSSSEALGLPSVLYKWGHFWLFSQSLWQTLYDLRFLS